MRFLIPAQTISEHRHRKMPVFETFGLSATSIALIGAGTAALGTAGSLGMQAYNASKKIPGYNAPSPQDVSQQQQMLVQNAALDAMQYAPKFTQQNIDLQNRVTPGSSAQREEALKKINSYIQGEIPLDVQQNINRQVAQNLGGGFNLYSGGGQAPQNFARNLGQTSLGLSQYGLSAAPTWQQLANTMVASPTQLFGSILQAGEFASGNQTQQAENKYQSAMNQYGGQQAQGQQIAQGLGALGSAGAGLMQAGLMANYYHNQAALSNPQVQGAQATLGQFGLPAMSASGSMSQAQMSALYGGLSAGETPW